MSDRLPYPLKSNLDDTGHENMLKELTDFEFDGCLFHFWVKFSFKKGEKGVVTNGTVSILNFLTLSDRV